MAADLVLAADPQIVERSAGPAGFAVAACERARAWLAEALEHGQIEQIAEVKSQAEAVRVYTVQKQLSKDAQLAAAEIVRRAERGIGLAIRRGQAAGQIRRPGQGGGQPPRAVRPRDDKTMSSPADFASHGELRGNGAGIYHLTDGVSMRSLTPRWRRPKRSRTCLARTWSARSASAAPPAPPGRPPARGYLGQARP